MSEVVVYTTIAVVYRVNSSSNNITCQDNNSASSATQRHSAPPSTTKRSAVATSASTLSITSNGSNNSSNGLNVVIPERAHSCSSMGARGSGQWRPIANGAWAQIHLFLEMNQDDAATRQTTTSSMKHSSSFRSSRSTSSSSSNSSHSSKKKHKGVVKNFRVVAWVLDTGKVIVNDVLFKGCKWEKVDTSFRRFTGLDGQIYGFGFRNEAQAVECSHIIYQILSNVKAITRLIKKYFTVRSSTPEYFSTIPDMRLLGFGQMQARHAQQTAEDAISDEKDTSDFCNRDTSTVVYPKLQNLNSVSADDDDLDSFTSIVNASYVKRSSGRHLLAQFTEVDLAALQQTEIARSLDQQGEEELGFRGTFSHMVRQLQIDCTHREIPLKTEGGGIQAVANEENASENPLEDDCLCEIDLPSDTDDGEQRSERVQGNTSSHVEIADNQTAAYEAVSSADKISFPFKTRQELHITYNVKHARYEGLPTAWRVLNHQFGLPLEAVPKRQVDGYESKIPAVLQMMKEYLLANNGTTLEGIFRLAPDKDQCNAVKEAINNGTFSGCTDVHIIANLIKVWFREIPQSLFNIVPVKHIYSVCTLQDPQQALDKLDEFPPLYKSVVLWLLDLMAEVVQNKEVNKMSARNMGKNGNAESPRKSPI